MNHDDDFHLVGDANYPENLQISGDVSGVGNLTVNGTLNIAGDISGTANIFVTQSVKVGGDVSGVGNINGTDIHICGDLSGVRNISAKTVTIDGDASGVTTINADKVVIKGDRGGSVTINSNDIKIMGDDAKNRAASSSTSTVFSGVTINQVRSGSNYGERSSSGSMSTSGLTIKWTSNGSASLINSRLCTQGATHTEVQVNSDRLVINNGDIGQDGIVRGGTVELNSKPVPANNPAGVDLSKLAGSVGEMFAPRRGFGSRFSVG